jgi:hypothetical protein
MRAGRDLRVRHGASLASPCCRIAGGHVLNDETGKLLIINVTEIIVEWSKGSM